MNDGSPDRLDPVGASSATSIPTKGQAVNTETTETRSPAEELCAAATLLRDTAAKATRGPWVYYPTVSRRDLDGDELPFTVSRGYCDKEQNGEPCQPDCGADVAKAGGMGCEEDVLGGDDAAWISLVNPLLAEPLAEWLETEALMVEKRGPSAEGQTFHALKVARFINGTAR